ncbi:TonB-dependent receptor [Flavobacteriaceae bacterium]|nr:TonB-dependent receptor [Flavobacteriaceae bacterium]MDG1673541.1 TonB-dependent receptor [Flavobacteriaceae bacterium]
MIRLLLCVTIGFNSLLAQNFSISGRVRSENGPLAFANIVVKNSNNGVIANEQGKYNIPNLKAGVYTLEASYIGYKSSTLNVQIISKSIEIDFDLELSAVLDEVVITSTLKPVKRSESPIPVEVFTAAFLKKNPTANIFEALQTVNGVRPQLNCSVCNTGNIRINGLEGPYSLVLIDGMPIVSGLSTVYGLSGIPSALIDQVEIIKGPASSLYGSEAVGGLINIITKHPENTPLLFFDSFLTDWNEYNLDVGLKALLGDKISVLFGVNYFNYNNPIDNNNDNFTDLALQDRISVFQKWSFSRPKNRLFSLAGRYFYEDRWGGEMQWKSKNRGGTEVYGESIYTSRFELIGNYQLPLQEKLFFQFSYSDHDQNSVYGDRYYLAKQRIGFGQLLWDFSEPKSDWLIGLSARYNYYNDNTTVTNTSDEVVVPSLFVQNEISLTKNHKLLLGGRYDYDNRHGSIFTPRLAFRYKPTDDDIFRVNAGTGFRIVNLFTEEHAALSGSRDLVIQNKLKPEQSFNINANYLKKIYTKKGQILSLDWSTWYTYFTNAIRPDYDTNPNLVIYDNLEGSATSFGLSFSLDAVISPHFKGLIGGTIQDVSQKENGIRRQQILTEKFSGTWALTYTNLKNNFTIDYTGNIYGPMRLAVLGPLDPRQKNAPIWSIQNILFTFKKFKNIELYTGLKNILNWTPNKGNPFIIARADDPFDDNVSFDNNGSAIVTANNPYGLTFDPTYIYAPNQGRRLFFGLRYNLN